MKDRFLKWLYRFSIRKYDKKTIEKMYFEYRKMYISGRYTGYALHQIHLKLSVLKEKMSSYAKK